MAVVHNTFLEVRENPATASRRALRRAHTDGHSPGETSISSWQRVNEHGDGIPGSQDSVLAEGAQRLDLNSDIASIRPGTDRSSANVDAPPVAFAQHVHLGARLDLA